MEENKKRTRLKNLKVFSVGLVGVPAIRRKFLILKRGKPSEKALSESKFPNVSQTEGAWKYCVCPNCGYVEPHTAGKQCYNIKCPKCGTKLVGSNTRQLSKEGGEILMSVARDVIKDAISQAAEEVVKNFETQATDAGDSVEAKNDASKADTDRARAEQNETDEDAEETVYLDENLEADIAKSAEELGELEKSAYTDCMREQLKAGKDFKEAAKYCKAKVKKSDEKKAPEKIGEKLEKTKVRVTVDTSDSSEKPEKVEKAPVYSGAFEKVFRAFDKYVEAAKKDEDKRKWRAMKALVSKTVKNLAVQKSEPSFEDFNSKLENVEAEISTILKAYPKPGEKYPSIEAGSFKSLFSLLDKLISGSTGTVKASYQKIKSILSKIIGGTYPYPAPAKKVEKSGEVSAVEELALLSEQVEELTKSFALLQKEHESLQKQLDKVPVPKGLAKGETPRAQGDNEEDVLKKLDNESPPNKLRAVIHELVKS